MSNLKELILEKERLENEIHKILKSVFIKILSAGLMKNEWNRIETYDSRNTSFEGFEHFPDSIQVKGYTYVGGGEYMNIYSDMIHFDEIGNIDLYINRIRKEISDREVLEKEAERLAEEKSNAAQEILEREQYETLKKKFGDA